MFLSKLFRLVPSDPFTRGLDLFNEGRIREAIAAFEPLLEASEEAVRSKAALYTCEAYLQLGDGLSAEDPETALECYEAARGLEPGFADLHNKAGELLLRLGRGPEAEAAFRSALGINGRYFAAHLNLCELLCRQGRWSEAVQELDELHAGAAPLYREGVGELRELCRQGGAEDPLPVFDRVRGLSPTRLEVARQSALEAIRRGEAQRAAEMLEELLLEYSSYPDLHHLMGLAYGELGRAEEAIQAFETALSLHPHYQKARINLALSYMEVDRLEEAQQMLEYVLRNDPGHPLALSALAEIEALAGRR